MNKFNSNKYYMSFEQKISQWLSIDDQLKILNDQIKILRINKNNISNDINYYVETNKLLNTSIKHNNNQLAFIKIKEQQQLTFKYLETCLGEII